MIINPHKEIVYPMKFETNSGIMLPNIINQLGPGVIGVELGVWYGNNAGYLLQECKNIEKLYGIDPYLPYQDWNRYIDKNSIDSIKNTAVSNLMQFGKRFVLIENTAEKSKKLFNDYSLDFIFIDGDHSFEMCYHDLISYYDKVKQGGLFSGHDYSLPGVNKALAKFRKERKIYSNFNVIPNDVWYWTKE